MRGRASDNSSVAYSLGFSSSRLGIKPTRSVRNPVAALRGQLLSLDSARADGATGREARRLIRDAIATLNPQIATVLAAFLEGGTLRGVFLDRKARRYKFEISDRGAVSYGLSEYWRADAKRDECDKGTPCGFGCISSKDKCGGKLDEPSKKKVEKAKSILGQSQSYSKSSSKADRMAGQMISNVFTSEELPRKKEVLSILGRASVESVSEATLSNPLGGVNQNRRRGKFVKEALELVTEKDLSNSKTAKEVAASILKNEDLQVNTAGFLGSRAGAMLGAIAGGIAGGPLGSAIGGYILERAADYGGARVVRDMKNAQKAHQEALSQLNEDEAFAAMSELEKSEALKGKKLDQYEAMAEQIQETKEADAAGWAIGNGFADITSVVVNIPLRGALAATIVVPEIMKARKSLKNGEPVGRVAKRTAKAIVTKPISQLMAPVKWEKETRAKAKRNIRALKEAVGPEEVDRLTQQIENMKT